MTTLFLDFDGVVNFEASRNAYRKHTNEFGLLGYLRRVNLPTRVGFGTVSVFLY